MKFKQFLSEEKEKKHTYHAFDMDEVLFHHDPTKLKIHVKDKSGKRVHSLNNQEFNSHNLKAGHSFDFSEFRSSHIFDKTAHPIKHMINKLKSIHKQTPHVGIITARSDMDDKEGFMSTLKHHGIDPMKVHVHRAGNLEGSPGDNKRKVVSGLIKKNEYTKVHMYDDSQKNLDHFASLKQDHPHVELHAHHVRHDPETDKVHIHTTVFK